MAICLCCFSCWFIITFILGVCGAAFYDGYSLISAISVTQIHRPSIPFIGAFDTAASIQLQEVSDPDIVPIQFYTLRQCFSQDSLMTINIDETSKVTFDSPTEKSKGLTEWYFLENTTLSVTITTEALPSYPADQCIAFLVVFSDFSSFKNFILTSSLESYYFIKCIANYGSQTSNINVRDKSYYYFGVYSDIPTEVGAVSVNFFGSYYQYDLSNLTFDCFLSSSNSLSCNFSPNPTFFSQNSCIVGFISPTDTVSGVRKADVGFFAAAHSESVKNTYFFIPFILVICLPCAFFCCIFVFAVCYQCIACLFGSQD